MSSQQNSKFNSEQYATILNFLEDPQNKAKVFGVSGKTEVGVAPPRKIEAWKELAILINSKYKGKYKLDHKSMADRWRMYFKKYKYAREKSSATGFGVLDKDRKRNVHTVQAKLDILCPHYERMHALVGERPNVTPVVTFDSGTISSGTDLNEVLRFNVEEVPNYADDDPTIAIVDCSMPDDITGNANDVIQSPASEHKQGTPGPEPEEDISYPIEVNAAPMPAAAHSKRPAMLDNNDGQKSKKDRRKELPSISGTKNPTQARNHLAQTIQDCASAKAPVLVTIEEKRLKFETMKWEIEREEREVRRMEEQERRQEDKEVERLRRAEEKAEKKIERRFALVQTMLADGKSVNEIKEVLDMLL